MGAGPSTHIERQDAEPCTRFILEWRLAHHREPDEDPPASRTAEVSDTIHAAVVLSFEFLVELDPDPRPLCILDRLDRVTQFIFLRKSSVADEPYRASLCSAHQDAHAN